MCHSDSDYGCQQCEDGYFNGYDQSDQYFTCSACSTICLKCTSSQGCVQCPDNYYLNGLIDCQPCPEDCLHCDFQRGCTECPPGFYPIAANETANSSCTGQCPSTCATCDGPDSCISCNPGYTLLNDTYGEVVCELNGGNNGDNNDGNKGGNSYAIKAAVTSYLVIITILFISYLL